MLGKIEYTEVDEIGRFQRKTININIMKFVVKEVEDGNYQYFLFNFKDENELKKVELGKRYYNVEIVYNGVVYFQYSTATINRQFPASHNLFSLMEF